jgi:hypothetical protein
MAEKRKRKTKRTPSQPDAPILPEQRRELIALLIGKVPEKLDEAKLGELTRLLEVLIKQNENGEAEPEIDLEQARQRLEHLVARLAESRRAGGADPQPES